MGMKPVVGLVGLFWVGIALTGCGECCRSNTRPKWQERNPPAFGKGSDPTSGSKAPVDSGPASGAPGLGSGGSPNPGPTPGLGGPGSTSNFADRSPLDRGPIDRGPGISPVGGNSFDRGPNDRLPPGGGFNGPGAGPSSKMLPPPPSSRDFGGPTPLPGGVTPDRSPMALPPIGDSRPVRDNFEPRGLGGSLPPRTPDPIRSLPPSGERVPSSPPGPGLPPSMPPLGGPQLPPPPPQPIN